MSSEYRVGIEIGGTKTLISLAVAEEIIGSAQFPTTSPGETLGRARAQVAAWVKAHPVQALGIASFGPLQLDPQSPDFGFMLKTPKHGWTHADILGTLGKDWPFPSAIDTDVNAAALAEHRWGAGRGEAAICYITIGTGVGGGHLFDGRLVHGAMHPEIGHIRIRRPSSDAFPGTCPFHGDCIEGLVSGPALAQRFSAKIEEVADSDPKWDDVARDIAELVSILLLTTAATRILFGGSVILKRPFQIDMLHKHVVTQIGGYLPLVGADTMTDIVMLAGLRERAGPLGSIALADLAAAHQ